MYTNIDTKLGINSIHEFLTDQVNNLPPNFPTDLVLQTLSIVMEHNMFSFADTFWLQLSGTAMGTPVACTYAMISFGQYENTEILPEFQPNLTYYKRYIDDILDIWLPTPNKNGDDWERFKTQQLGFLKMGHTRPFYQSTVFRPRFKTQSPDYFNGDLPKTYEPLSIHSTTIRIHPPPPSCLKGLICGELRRCTGYRTYQRTFKTP